MHALKLCAATAATLIAIAAVGPAAAQFFDPPPPVQKKTKKAKTAPKPPVAPTAPPVEAAQPPAQTPPPAQATATAEGTHPAKRPPPPPPHENCKNTGNFAAWLEGFKRRAAAQGISHNTMSRALDGLALDGSVIARDRKQGFFAQTFLDFQAKLATANRVQSSRRKIAENKATFDRVQQQFGVPASVITGFWALESDFGAGMGKLSVLRSLATLAYDCRRPQLFHDQLMAALSLLIVTIWLVSTKRNPAYAGIPMVFMYVTTMASTLVTAYNMWSTVLFPKGQLQTDGFALFGGVIMVGVAALLFVCAAIIAWDGWKAYQNLTRGAAATPAPAPGTAGR